MAFQVRNPNIVINSTENDVGPRKAGSVGQAGKKFAFQDRSNVVLKKVTSRTGKGTPVKAIGKTHMSIAKKLQMVKPIKISSDPENIPEPELATKTQMNYAGNEENMPDPEWLHAEEFCKASKEADFYAPMLEDTEKKIEHGDVDDEPADSPYRTNFNLVLHDGGDWDI